MRLTIPKDILARGLSLVGRAVSSQTTLPVLSNILLRTEGARLQLSATNLTIAITCWLPASIETEGAITVPAKTLTDVVASIASGDSIAITLKDDTLAFKASTSKTEIKGLPAEDFPLLPRGNAQTGSMLEVEAGALRNAIRKTLFCAATDNARPTLTGVLFKAGDGQGTLAATDGFRLAVAQLPVQGEAFQVIIPSEALTHLDRILDEEGLVTVRLPPNRTQVIFTTPSFELVSQLVEGQYPNYEQIIPKGPPFTAEVNAIELWTAVKAVDIFAREEGHAARFMFTESGLQLLGRSPYTGSGEAQVSARFGGAVSDSLPFEIAFNAKYVLEALKAFDGQCAIGLTDPLRPALFTPPAGGSFEMVIMPIRIGK